MKIKLEDLRKAANEILIQIGKEQDISHLTRLELEGCILGAILHEDFDDEELSDETQNIFQSLTGGDIGYSDKKDLTQLN